MQLTANSLLFSNKIIEERKRNDTVVVGIVGDSRCQNKIQHFFLYLCLSARSQGRQLFLEFEFEFVTIVFLKRFPNSLRSVLAVNVEQNNNLPTITLLLVTCKAIYCLQLYLFFSADVINVTSDTRVHIRSKDVFTRLVLHISLPAYIGYPIISVLCRREHPRHYLTLLLVL